MRDRLILICAALAAFGASLGGSFHFDDYAIFADPVLTSPSGWWEVWRPLATRPLTYFTFWLNYQLGGQYPAGYHLFNLTLHLTAVLLLYAVMRRTLDRPAALLAAAIFAVHPIQSEAVNYIWARSALLMTVLCLLSLREWLEGRYWFAVAWFGLALLAKEECAAYPLLLVVLHRFTKRDTRRWLPIGTMLLLSLAAGAHVFYALRHVPGAGAGAQAGISPPQYLLASGPVVWRYLGLLLVPWGFTVDPAISVPPLWLGLVAWAALAGSLAFFSGAGPLARGRSPGRPLRTHEEPDQGGRCGRGRPPYSWLPWLIGGLVLLLPSSSIFPAADLAADRRVYLPMVAFSAALSLGLTRFPRKPQVVVLAVLAILSFLRTQVWMTEKSLWTEAVVHAPDKVRPKLQLARASDSAEAADLLAQAKKLAPSDPAVASESGKMLLLLGRPQDALPEFGRALALSPRDAEAFNNRGVALQALGQAYAARRDFEHALRLAPCLFDPRYNLLMQGVSVPAAAGCRYTPEQQRQLTVGR